jgi:hypothetical protein
MHPNILSIISVYIWHHELADPPDNVLSGISLAFSNIFASSSPSSSSFAFSRGKMSNWAIKIWTYLNSLNQNPPPIGQSDIPYPRPKFFRPGNPPKLNSAKSRVAAKSGKFAILLD